MRDSEHRRTAALRGTISQVVYLGTVRKYVVECLNGATVVIRVQVDQDGSDLRPGTEVVVGWGEHNGVLVGGSEDLRDWVCP